MVDRETRQSKNDL